MYVYVMLLLKLHSNFSNVQWFVRWDLLCSGVSRRLYCSMGGDVSMVVRVYFVYYSYYQREDGWDICTFIENILMGE